MTEDEAFLRAVVDSPGDDTPRLVYADWLGDHDDPRGPYLRAEHEWAKRRTRTGAPYKPKTRGLANLAAGLDVVWVARVSRPPVGVCCDHVRFTDHGPQLTPGEIDVAEEVIGCEFPAAYRAFLLNYNAGRVEPRDPPPSENATAVCEEAQAFCTLGQKPRSVEEPDYDLVRGTQYLRELAAGDFRASNFPTDRLIPLATPRWDFDEVFLGVGRKEFGKVYRLYNLQDHGFDRENLSLVAKSLPEFLAALKPVWEECE